MFRNRFGYRHHRRRAVKRKGLFGGEIASYMDIRHLNKSIEAQEADEFKAFEVEFDQKLKNL